MFLEALFVGIVVTVFLFVCLLFACLLLPFVLILLKMKVAASTFGASLMNVGTMKSRNNPLAKPLNSNSCHPS